MNKLTFLRRIMGWLKLSPAEVIYELQSVRFEQSFPIIYEDGYVSKYIDPDRRAIAIEIKPDFWLGLQCTPNKMMLGKAEEYFSEMSRENEEWELCSFYEIYSLDWICRARINNQLKQMGFDVLKQDSQLGGRDEKHNCGYFYPRLRFIPRPKLPLSVFYSYMGSLNSYNYVQPDKHPLAMSIEDGDIAVWKFAEKMTLEEAKAACEALNNPESDTYLGTNEKWVLCNYFTLRKVQEYYDEIAETLEKLQLEPLADDDVYWSDSDDLIETENQGMLPTGLKRAVKLSTGEVTGCHPSEKHYAIAYFLNSEYMGL